MTKDATPEYRALIGFSHEPKNADPLRFEPGERVTGVPAENCRALAEAGVLEMVAAKAKPAPKAAKAMKDAA